MKHSKYLPWTIPAQERTHVHVIGQHITSAPATTTNLNDVSTDRRHWYTELFKQPQVLLCDSTSLLRRFECGSWRVTWSHGVVCSVTGSNEERMSLSDDMRRISLHMHVYVKHATLHREKSGSCWRKQWFKDIVPSAYTLSSHVKKHGTMLVADGLDSHLRVKNFDVREKALNNVQVEFRCGLRPMWSDCCYGSARRRGCSEMLSIVHLTKWTCKHIVAGAGSSIERLSRVAAS